MIGKIKGTLTEIEQNIALIETKSGLYYQVHLTPQLLNKYKQNQTVEIYTYLQIKENEWTLYGFQNKNQRNFYKLLQNVSGVGPKLAYTIISYSTIKELTQAIKQNNTNYFTNIPGLGKKTSMKIILELSQRLNQQIKLTNLYLSDEDKTIVEALISLGFKTHQAKETLSKIPKNLTLEQKITHALKTIKNR